MPTGRWIVIDMAVAFSSVWALMSDMRPMPGTAAGQSVIPALKMKIDLVASALIKIALPADIYRVLSLAICIFFRILPAATINSFSIGGGQSLIIER